MEQRVIAVVLSAVFMVLILAVIHISDHLRKRGGRRLHAAFERSEDERQMAAIASGKGVVRNPNPYSYAANWSSTKD